MEFFTHTNENSCCLYFNNFRNFVGIIMRQFHQVGCIETENLKVFLKFLFLLNILVDLILGYLQFQLSLLNILQGTFYFFDHTQLLNLDLNRGTNQDHLLLIFCGMLQESKPSFVINFIFGFSSKTSHKISNL